MAEKGERVREMARRVGLATIGAELEERVACAGCPAAEFIASVRADGMPGVRCRIEHQTLSLGSDPKTVFRWCSQASVADKRLNGYVACPTWQFEKLQLALGGHSLSDEARLNELSDRTWRDDVTGSPYGDLSIFEEASKAAEDTVTAWQEAHAERQGQ